MNQNFSMGKFFLRSIFYYRKLFLLTALTSALTAMVISGALIIGDSLRDTLSELSQNRLGKAKAVVITKGPWFRSSIEKALGEKFSLSSSALISLPAYGSTPKAQRSVSMTLYGVAPSFFALAPRPTKSNLEPGEAYINPTTAKALGLGVGDFMVLRYLKPSQMPGDAPFAPSQVKSLGSRLKITGILDGPHFGDFTTETTQQIGAHIFVNRDWLAVKLGRPGRANMLLSDQGTQLSFKLQKVFQLADYGLELRSVKKTVELTSRRVFLSPLVEKIAGSIEFPQQKILCSFVSSIRYKNREVSYSFVAGVDGEPVPANFKTNQVVINQWMARRLDCSKGAKLTIRGYQIDSFGGLTQKTFTCYVQSIVPLAGSALDPQMMPLFPGLAKVKNCRDWSPGMAIDFSKIDPADEAYWKKYRGTPKVFMTLPLAQQLWGNRFGRLTALRFQGASAPEIEKALTAKLDPEGLGFHLIDLEKESRQGVGKAVDFGGLFIGLSFFILVSALLLSALVFRFYLEQRQGEWAILEALGFSRKSLWRQYSGEALVCCILSCVPGVLGGIFYGWLMIQGLNTIWNGAVHTSRLHLSIQWTSLAMAALGTVFSVMAALIFSLHSFLKESSRAMLTGETKIKTLSARAYGKRSLLFFAMALGTVVLAPGDDGVLAKGIFFGAGSLVLVALIYGSGYLLSKLPRFFGKLTTATLAWRNCVRRPGRSLAVIGLLSCGIFLTLAVAANRQGLLSDGFQKQSGTGGFALWGERALPIRGDLNSDDKRAELKIEKLDPSVSFVQLASKAGSEASCLNLNRVLRPNISGVSPGALVGRFSFEKTLGAKGWAVLSRTPKEANVIPAVADMAVIQWILGKKLGGELKYRASGGKVFRLRFVGGLKSSVFQGRVLISLKNFYRMFPSATGSSIFLVDSPPEKMEESRKILATSLAPLGLESCVQRLARFNSVQNTYLAVFMALGAISLLLGCLGLAVLIRRNIEERKSELAYLRVLGFSSYDLTSLLFYEHLLLFGLALLCGVISVWVATVPSLRSPSADLPLLEMTGLMGLVFLFGLGSILWASGKSKKGMLASLREMD